MSSGYWVLVFLGWLVLSFPIAIFFGKMIKRGSKKISNHLEKEFR